MLPESHDYRHKMRTQKFSGRANELAGQTSADRTELPGKHTYAERSAIRTTFSRSIARVIGPTPPGLGV